MELFVVPYILYGLGFVSLILLPTEHQRLYYLHLVSVIIGLISNYEMKFNILLSMFHSAVHNLWPFLKNTGYDDTEKSVYDVFCHTIMMMMCYHRIYYVQNIVIDSEYLFHTLSVLFILGAMINCLVSRLIIDSHHNLLHYIFEYTTIFQAVSTGYWVATMLWYNNLNHQDFYYHWLLWIILMTINWFVYKLWPNLVGISMRYKYVEAVFIICTWYSGVFSNQNFSF
ncbi:hypothetical protein QJ850_gp158 [Acanthamoeba polyphaga mimivirus]|uniref:Uncharacterized protein n=1 Tax=Acanthamoeba polyphaga mimivirus Kroon TaxID=3069720 RepID=A0A0G2YBV7_9VIRU|nr:hypothetical protein QJ850_gp158 [Acanthamoeba polyphaga mimivirus]AKI80541.1 hypothetical protein [Acanthamoeba polyphaga mimivirus Kroon]